ncbi:MAG TPA: alginate export family protein [Gemmatimonadales bacterium]|jgi:hypothetical protein
MKTRAISIACAAALAAAGLPGAARAQTRVTSSDTSTWLGISGQLRLRGEGWTGFGAGAPVTARHDDAFGLTRLKLRAEAHLRGALALVAEIKSSLVTDRSLAGGRRPSDEDVVDFQQFFAELHGRAAGASTTIRGGRFDLALGRERLVSPLDWTNSQRAFQGIQATATGKGNQLQLFWVRPVIMRQSLADLPDPARQLYGAQLARTWPNLRAEFYWLRNETRTATYNGTTGYEQRHTIGTRLSRRPAAGSADADVEVAFQLGSVGGAPVRAWMVGSQAGWTLPGSLGARFYAGFDAASGDHAAGGSVQTFNQLYPLGHAYLGYADVHGRQNVLDGSVGGSVKIATNLALLLDAHDFYRASQNDALYAVDGSVSRPAGTGRASHVGEELDLTLRRAAAQGRLILQAGVSRYFAGTFLRQSGPALDMNFIYGQVTASF